MFSVRFQTPSAGAEEIHPVRQSEKKMGERSWIFLYSSTTAFYLLLTEKEMGKKPQGGLGGLDPPPKSTEITWEKWHI